VLEDGRLTDNKGRTVDFTNVVLVLTSNVGSREILSMAKRQQRSLLEKLRGVTVKVDGATPPSDDEGSGYRRMRAAVKAELGRAFRPEFLNRLDEVIVFEALTKRQVGSIAELMLAELRERCAENEVTLKIGPNLVDAVVDAGFSATYGARPLRRAVQRRPLLLTLTYSY